MISLRPAVPETIHSRPDAELSPQTVLFLSSCPEPWGGSEELWSEAAQGLSRGGHRVSVCKTLVVKDHQRIAELRVAGIPVDDYWGVSYLKLLAILSRTMLSVIFRKTAACLHYSHRNTAAGAPARKAAAASPYTWKQRLLGLHQQALSSRLRRTRPDLVVISQGENFDGLSFAEACAGNQTPYVLICQKASDLNWPADSVRATMRLAFQTARRVYFVSEHNRALTERQMGCRLTNAEVVRNPFLTKLEAPLPYPQPIAGRFRLACVARLFVMEKGQDMLLQVLAQEKWRRRNIEVNFYGQGIHREALERAAEMLELANVHFHGFTNDVTAVWEAHHALVLPSRAEGLPLVLVEAMLCGRPGIVTNAGGNAELLEDERTGFLAGGADAVSLDDALERAWKRRDEWEAIGQKASAQIRRLIPDDPGGDFTVKLTTILTQIQREAQSHNRI